MAKVLNNEELAKMANLARGGKRVTTVTSYNRNVAVKELAKRFTEGYCQLCNNPAPFKDKFADSYLEVHHIEWLAGGGEKMLF